VSGGSLAEVVLAYVASLDGDIADLRAAGSVHEIVADGTLVGVIEPAALQVRLRPAIAGAALRTPDVEASPRGDGWVRFAPPEMDDFARDRAIAWLESAIRLVIEGAEPEDTAD
jgi:hypothetical protein